MSLIPFDASAEQLSAVHISNRNPILAVRNLHTEFLTAQGTVKAVDGVSFSLPRGRTLGLVGESGCGKSVTALSILRLLRFPGRITSGEIWLSRPANGIESAGPINLLKISEREMREVRGARIAMVFQEPMTALNPVFTIGNQIIEAIGAHEAVRPREAWRRAVDMLEAVAIPLPQLRMNDYPHQLSGGLRQRAMIAMALATRPELLIADEPTTALDVTIQSQILELLADLKERFRLSLLIISHDLGVIAQVADAVAIMYAGKIVEQAPAHELFANPLHPYTQALLAAVPRLDDFRHHHLRLEAIPGNVPDLRVLPSGCAFQPRCKFEMGVRCSGSGIPMTSAKFDHQVRCVKYG
jgi:peptide/nickel transport system ATP-binding protein